jgi:hypothetical protein
MYLVIKDNWESVEDTILNKGLASMVMPGYEFAFRIRKGVAHA